MNHIPKTQPEKQTDYLKQNAVGSRLNNAQLLVSCEAMDWEVSSCIQQSPINEVC